MFGMGWSEIILIGVIALIVIGPNDFPKMFRKMGEFTGKARVMAREFSRAMEAAADESGVKDVQKTLRAATNPAGFGVDKIREAATTALKPGGETEKLSKDRAEAKAKFDEKATELAEKRRAKEANATEAPKAEADVAPDPDASPKASPDPAPEPAPKDETPQ